MRHLINALMYCEEQANTLWKIPGNSDTSVGTFSWRDWDDAATELQLLLDALEEPFNDDPEDDERNVDAWEGGFAWNH